MAKQFLNRPKSLLGSVGILDKIETTSYWERMVGSFCGVLARTASIFNSTPNTWEYKKFKAEKAWF